MKKILVNLLTFSAVIAVIIAVMLTLGSDEGARYVHKGNTEYQPVGIKPGEYQCSECNMDVEALKYSAQLIAKNGNTYFFDDIGCVVLWLENHTVEREKILTMTLDTGRWIEAEKAWYTRTAPSPMGYGFAAYEKKRENFISYGEMRVLMLQGKHLHDPFVKKALLK